ncbi:MAG TPA: translocation/assembly module TamB domain-containing protein [Flavobacteriaceae bacterium]|nr:translocation/assembly module TamB domain-containing protein [Flavobacteriaceae bacterium]
MSKKVASQEKKHTKHKKAWWQRLLKIFWRIFQVLVVLIILLLLFIRSPWGQGIITTEATKFVSKKTNTAVSIDKLFITFSGKVNLQGLYLEDKQGDTLVYSKELEAAIPLIPIIKGEPISLNRLTWNGLKANVYRKDSIAGYNFQFLIDAFAGDPAQAKPEEPKPKDQKLPEINVGSIDFSNFDLTFDDAVMGIDAKLNLGNFKFRGKNIDLNKMVFEAKKLQLENTEINYTQTKPFAETKDTAASTLPFFRLDELKLTNVKANYKSIPDDMEAEADLSDFLVEVPKADLAKQDIEINRLNLHQSDIHLSMGKPSEADKKAKELGEDAKDEVEEAFTFEWPDWNVKVRSIDFADNNLLYQVGEKPKHNKQFNPDFIDLKDFTLAVEDLELGEEEYLTADFKQLAFRENHSDLNLEQLGFKLNLNKTELGLKDFVLQTVQNKLNGQLGLQYTSINELIQHPDQSDFNVDLSDFSIDLKEAFRFAPDLKSNEYVAKLSRNKITGKIKAKGSLAQLDLPVFNVRWGSTNINTRGKLRNLTIPEQLYASIDHFRLNTIRQEVLVFVDEEEIGITVPETIYMQSELYGSLDDLKTKTLLQIPEGEINVDGSFKNKELIAFDAVLDVTDFDLGKILNNPNIGKIELNLKTQGHGSSLENLTGDIDAEFSKLEFNNYDFSALKIKGNLTDGNGSVFLNYLDDNLNMLLTSKIQMDSLGQKLALDLDIEKADLQKLNLMDKEINTNISLMADLKNNKEGLSLESHLIDGNIYYDDKTYLLGAWNMGGTIEKDSTFFAINSKILSGQLAANAPPEEVGQAVERQLKRYFKEDTVIETDTLRKSIMVDADMIVTPHPILTDMLVPGIVEMDTVAIKAKFDQKKDILNSNVSLSLLNFENNIINELYFDINAGRDVAQFILGFDNLNAGGFGMYKTYLTGDLTDGILTANFFSLDEDEEIFYSFHSQTSGENNNIRFHLLPYNLMLNNETWNIPEDNEIVFKEKSIEAHNFELNKENRSLKVANDLMETKSKNIGIGFKDFNLETLIALVNPDEHLAEGNLQGDIVVVNPMDKIGILADFGIDELQVYQTPLGNLSLKALSKELNEYRFKMDLKGKDVDLGAKGSFVSKEVPEFKLDFNIDRLGMETLGGLSQNELTQGSGYLSGNIAIEGSTKSPKYDGQLKFNEASFKVAQLNTKFTFDEDAIEINDRGLRFNNFTIQDEKNQELSVNGNVIISTLRSPKFDLKLKANNFQLMNSTEEHNDLFYGKANVDLDGTIKGRTASPDIDMDITVKDDTDFTYALSAAQTAKETQEGVVKFVNRDAPVYVIENKKDSIKNAEIKGMSLHTNIKIDKGATFSVIVDPRTNDNLQITGDGDLDFRINPNGQMNLSGRYTIDDGYYKLSLYNLVKRKFDFQKGSSINWSGDLMDADLDVTAIYSVKASPAGLMGSATAGESEEDRNRYKQKLPFLVYLNVGGSIDKPDLSFGLDLEEESKGAMGGSVYSQVRQTQENEGELNKQVFSLLVLNRFFPQGSDGSGGGFASMARDNLNQALTDQLNNFSDQFTGDSGFRLSFGLDSYETYSGGSFQQRTDLDITAEQRLFNDRFIVKVGTEMNVQGDLQPGEERPLVGNVSIEYLLTEDGRWRLRGFRKNEYENVIDGQIFTNGIGVLFQRDFNRFKYLWRSMFHDPDKYFAELREKRKQEENKEGIEKEAVRNNEENDQSKNNTD